MADTMQSMHVPERREYARLLLGKDVLYLLPRHCCAPSKGPILANAGLPVNKGPPARKEGCIKLCRLRRDLTGFLDARCTADGVDVRITCRMAASGA